MAFERASVLYLSMFRGSIYKCACCMECSSMLGLHIFSFHLNYTRLYGRSTKKQKRTPQANLNAGSDVVSSYLW